MTVSEIVSQKSKFAEQKIGNELILVPLKDNIANMTEMFTLNEVGGFIWEQLRDEITETEIIHSICQAFEIDSATARQDYSAFIHQLEQFLA